MMPTKRLSPSRSSPSVHQRLILLWCLSVAIQLASAGMATLSPERRGPPPSPSVLPRAFYTDSTKPTGPMQTPAEERDFVRQHGQFLRRLEDQDQLDVIYRRTAAEEALKDATSSSKTSSKKTSSSKTSSKKTSSSKTSSKKTSSSKTSSKKTSSSKTSSSKTSSATTSSKKTSSTKTSSTTSKSTSSSAAGPLVTSGMHLLIQNDLNWKTIDSHKGYLLLEIPQTYGNATTACVRLSEKLATPSSSEEDLMNQLSYLIYKGVYKSGQIFWTGSQKLLTLKGTTGAYTLAVGKNTAAKYPLLCTQSAPRRTAYKTDDSSKWYVKVQIPGGSNISGYRDGLSFRFHAIPYADRPLRFAYSSVYSGTKDIDATVNQPKKQCPQASGSYSEDCLVLSIWTNYLHNAVAATPEAESVLSRRGQTKQRTIEPRATDKSVKPIMLWIHGGSGVAGTGLDPTFDGGQMASRGDVVMVTLNYRLGNLGFLPVPDGEKGNYAMQDVVTALKWLQTNAATFGGDPSRITVFGQSAGANIVQFLLGNPSASGLFNNVIIQSSKPSDQYNGARSPALASARAATVIESLGCGNVSSTLACLRALPVKKFLSAGIYSVMSVDGNYVPQEEYALNGRGSTTNSVPVIIGFMRDEQAALGYVPPTTLTNLTKALTNAGVPSAAIEIAVGNPSVFSTKINNGVQNLTVGIEGSNSTGSRCGIPATAYAASLSGSFPKIWVYTQDQRAYQIPNYDPNDVCQPPKDSSAGIATSYYFCHSGDLMPTFANIMYEFGDGDRDGKDLIWFRNQVDQWTAFAHHSNPNPTSAYVAARNYSKVQGATWPAVDTTSGPSGSKMISLGVTQGVIPLAKYASQCNLFGTGLKYIVNGGAAGDDYGDTHTTKTSSANISSKKTSSTSISSKKTSSTSISSKKTSSTTTSSKMISSSAKH